MIKNKIFRIINNLKSYDVFPVVSCELEFYINDVNKVSKIKKICSNLSWIYRIVAEKGNNQFEIISNFFYNPVELADNLDNIRNVIKKNSGIFHPKPFKTEPGSAFHINFYLINKDNQNLFKERPKILSFSIGGICSSIKQHMLDFAPFVSSYSRFQHHDMYTPIIIGWSTHNRNACIRLKTFPHLMLEHRLPGSDVNFANSIFVVLSSVLYGIENSITADGKIYNYTFPFYNKNLRIPLTFTEAQKYRF